MIRYRLKCHKSHEFEAWFASSTAYDKVERAGQLSCPDCGSSKVTKALMAPGVATRRTRGPRAERRVENEAGQERHELAHVPDIAAADAAAGGEIRTEAQRQFLELMRKVRQEVASNAEYVGPRFADEARKIHLQEAEPRGIWGEATLQEAQELNEEGIDCLPLPRLPEDQN